MKKEWNKRRSLEVLNNEEVNYAKTKFIQNEDLFLRFIGFLRKTFVFKNNNFCNKWKLYWLSDCLILCVNGLEIINKTCFVLSNAASRVTKLKVRKKTLEQTKIRSFSFERKLKYLLIEWIVRSTKSFNDRQVFLLKYIWKS